jgi:DNA invertase Pin-like site-specific DNA recombinase
MSSDRDLGVSEKIVTKLHQEQVKLDDNAIRQLIIDYKNGLNMNELARKYNCHRTTISQKLRMSGVTIRRLPPNDEQIDRMVTLYQSGLSLETVGNKIGVSASTVSRHIAKRGMVTRDEHGREKSV